MFADIFQRDEAEFLLKQTNKKIFLQSITEVVVVVAVEQIIIIFFNYPAYLVHLMISSSSLSAV